MTDTANTHGTLTVLKAALDAGVRRVVHASSSSVYGGAAPLPTSEDAPLRPRSPYAVSKLAAEEYCRVFTELYGLETVALRYFNVYGPRQRPDATYAAVIPLFIDALLNGRDPDRARRRPAVPRLHVHLRRRRREPRGGARRRRRVRGSRLQHRRRRVLDAARRARRARRAARRRAAPEVRRAPRRRRAPQPGRPDRGRAPTSASARRSRSKTACAATVDWLRSG